MNLYVLLREITKTGGASRSTIEISEQLARKGHKITFISFSKDYSPTNCTIKLLIFPKFILDIKQKYIRLLLINPFFAILSTIYLIANSKKIDLVWSPMGHTFYKGIFTAQSCHKALIKQKIHNGDFLWIFNFLHYWGLFLDWYNYRSNLGITAISNVLKNDIMNSYRFLKPQDVEVIHHGVNEQEFKPTILEKKNEQKRKLGFNEKDVLMIFVGYEYKRKGLIHIINIFGNLPKHVKLLIVGNDPLNIKYYENHVLKSGLQNQIKFLGNHPDIYCLYSASDIFVFPTLMDAFGLVIIEAMSSGLPIITTSTAGASEIMSHGNNGFILSVPFKEETLLSYLKEIINDDNVRNQMSINSRKLALKKTWEIVAIKYEKYFENILNR